MQNQTYAFNGVKIQFDVDEWLATGCCSYSREQMPQVDIKKFEEHLPMFRSYLQINTETIEAAILKPTQNEINFSNCLMNVASLKDLDDDKLIFICSNDYHIVDGHHRLVQQLLVDSKRLVKCYVVDLDIHDLLIVIKSFDMMLTDTKDINGNVTTTESLQLLIESFGVQGPEAVPGMGAVNIGSPSTSDDRGTKGSGDIPVAITKKKKYTSEDYSKMTIEEVCATKNTKIYTNEELSVIKESDELVAMSKANGPSRFITSSELKELARTSNINWVERLKALRIRRGEDPETGEILDEVSGERTGRYALDEEDDCFDRKYRKDITTVTQEALLESMGDISPEEWAKMTANGTTIDSTNTLELNTIIEATNDDSLTTYKIVCRDSESSLKNIIEYIQKIGNQGHSMTIVVDEGEDGEKKFGWDGDGYDYIKSIDIISNANEDVANDKNSEHLKLDKHFENADGLELLTCMNKPVQRKCLQINEPFSCKTLEGITQGKADDYLVQGVDGEIYPCDKDIFEETYQITSELEQKTDIT